MIIIHRRTPTIIIITATTRTPTVVTAVAAALPVEAVAVMLLYVHSEKIKETSHQISDVFKTSDILCPEDI